MSHRGWDGRTLQSARRFRVPGWRIGRKVYIGGDGGYDKRFKEIRERFGVIDLAFLENGQYNANWKYIHTMPEDLEKAILDLQAKQVFTVHHDKYSLAMHPWYEPDNIAKKIAVKYNIHLLDAPIGTVVRYEWWVTISPAGSYFGRHVSY